MNAFISMAPRLMWASIQSIANWIPGTDWTCTVLDPHLSSVLSETSGRPRAHGRGCTGNGGGAFIRHGLKESVIQVTNIEPRDSLSY
jgi:hypothetical protein